MVRNLFKQNNSKKEMNKNLGNEVHQNTPTKHPKKRNELDTILLLLKANFTKKQVREKLNISKTSLANYLGKLEDGGLIRRRGKYIIDILPSSSKHPRVTRNQVHHKLNKRGHAFNFKIIFPQEENLKLKPKVKEFLNKKKATKLKFGSIKFTYKKNTIWINKGSLTIYSNNSYYSKNALHSKFIAIRDIDTVCRHLKHKFELRGIYGIEIFREHYGLIFNEFASWILAKREKLDIKNKNNKSILWVDDSKKDDIGLKEFEADDPLRINKADNYFKSQEKTGWKYTPELQEKIFNEQSQTFDKLFKLNLKINQVVEQQTKNLIDTIKLFNLRLDKAGI